MQYLYCFCLTSLRISFPKITTKYEEISNFPIKWTYLEAGTPAPTDPGSGESGAWVGFLPDQDQVTGTGLCGGSHLTRIGAGIPVLVITSLFHSLFYHSPPHIQWWPRLSTLGTCVAGFSSFKMRKRISKIYKNCLSCSYLCLGSFHPNNNLFF